MLLFPPSEEVTAGQARQALVEPPQQQRQNKQQTNVSPSKGMNTLRLSLGLQQSSPDAASPRSKAAQKGIQRQQDQGQSSRSRLPIVTKTAR